MATNTALSSGNWNDNARWSLGHVPIAGEDVDFSDYDVTMNIARIPASGTLHSITQSGSGALIIPLDTLGNCGIYTETMTSVPGSGVADIISITGATSNTITIEGDIIDGPWSGSFLDFNSTGNLIFNGDVTSGNNLGTGIRNVSGIVTMTGNVTGGGANTYAIDNFAGTIYVTGDVTGGSSNYSVAIKNNNAGIIDVTGNVTGSTAGTSSDAIKHEGSTGTINVTGVVTGGAGVGSNGIYCTGLSAHTPIINIDGSVIGGTAGAGTSYGINASGVTATINIEGNVTGGAFAHAVYCSGTPTITVLNGNITGSAANKYGFYFSLAATVALTSCTVTGPGIYANNGGIFTATDTNFNGSSTASALNVTGGSYTFVNGIITASTYTAFSHTISTTVDLTNFNLVDSDTATAISATQGAAAVLHNTGLNYIQYGTEKYRLHRSLPYSINTSGTRITGSPMSGSF